MPNSFSNAITQTIPNGLAGIHDTIQIMLIRHIAQLAHLASHPARAGAASGDVASAGAGAARPLHLPSHELKAGFPSFQQELLELLYLVRRAPMACELAPAHSRHPGH